ncbi:hypothetical protein BC830DRAFT_1164886 [Chytriomyces sp. MP71]|nr:hypothetical protein BC830DRAFT_1164886 [Chytriomyces sp. MP71]
MSSYAASVATTTVAPAPVASAKCSYAVPPASGYVPPASTGYVAPAAKQNLYSAGTVSSVNVFALAAASVVALFM